jgi:hypothetical protein
LLKQCVNTFVNNEISKIYDETCLVVYQLPTIDDEFR